MKVPRHLRHLEVCAIYFGTIPLVSLGFSRGHILQEKASGPAPLQGLTSTWKKHLPREPFFWSGLPMELCPYSWDTTLPPTNHGVRGSPVSSEPASKRPPAVLRRTRPPWTRRVLRFTRWFRRAAVGPEDEASQARAVLKRSQLPQPLSRHWAFSTGFGVGGTQVMVGKICLDPHHQQNWQSPGVVF